MAWFQPAICLSEYHRTVVQMYIRANAHDCQRMLGALSVLSFFGHTHEALWGFVARFLPAFLVRIADSWQSR